MEEKKYPNCPICQQKMRHGKVLICTHKFHKGCIKKWFKRKNTCPICRDVGDRPMQNYDVKSNMSPDELEDQITAYNEFRENKTRPHRILVSVVVDASDDSEIICMTKKQNNFWTMCVFACGVICGSMIRHIIFLWFTHFFSDY